MIVGLLAGPLDGSAMAATVDTTRNNAWTSFANNSITSYASWSGADGTIGVKLPDGKVSFAFSDTLRGPVTPEGFHPPFQTAGVFNSMVIADSTSASAALQTVRVLDEGNNWNAKPLVPADPGYKYWAGDGGVYGGRLVRFYTRLTAGPSGCFIVGEPKSTYVAKFDLTDPNGRPELPTYNAGASYAISPTFAPQHISWGTAILDDGGYTYIYGSEDDCGQPDRRLHIARVPTGQFNQPWEQVADLPMPNGLGSEFSVSKVGSTYQLITLKGNDRVIVAYPSSTPASFGGTPTVLYNLPVYKSSDLLQYAARMQPALTTSSEVVLSYNTNTVRVSKDGCVDENVLDASIYRPRFVRLSRSALPSASSAARTTTAAPFPPTATAARRGLVWNTQGLAGRPAAQATAQAMAAASVPIPIGSVVWGPRDACGANASPSNLTATKDPAPALTTKVTWTYKGPTVDTSVARWTPNEGWSALPLMLLGASPLPAVPAIQSPPLSVLSGTPQRVQWTDTPYAQSGQTIKYQLCIKPANRGMTPDVNDTDGRWQEGEPSPDCQFVSLTIP